MRKLTTRLDDSPKYSATKQGEFELKSISKRLQTYPNKFYYCFNSLEDRSADKDYTAVVSILS